MNSGMLRDYLIKDFRVKILFSVIHKKQLFRRYKSAALISDTL